jgi:hypothetical protein
MENTISIEIPADVKAAVAAKFGEIEALLKPYAVSIAEDEKGALLKIADKTIPFVDKVEGYVVTAPEFIPNHMDVPEFVRDKTALDSLDAMLKVANPVMSLISDTLELTANDSFSAALLYFRSVRQASNDGVAKAKPIYEDLAKRFPGRPKSAKSASAAKA